jgi:glycosyltransferase involved in cell wall biosynthesis
MPYRSNGYTKYIFPIKVNEYLAAGKPTIGTPIRTLQDYGDVITLATTSDEWVAVIQEMLALASADPDVARRVEYARRFSWDEIVGSIASRIGAHNET